MGDDEPVDVRRQRIGGVERLGVGSTIRAGQSPACQSAW
jgi:hypothetical protein